MEANGQCPDTLTPATYQFFASVYKSGVVLHCKEVTLSYTSSLASVTQKLLDSGYKSCFSGLHRRETTFSYASSFASVTLELFSTVEFLFCSLKRKTILMCLFWSLIP